MKIIFLANRIRHEVASRRVGRQLRQGGEEKEYSTNHLWLLYYLGLINDSLEDKM
ncbi:hypothetical protein [Nostoc sp. T09]|uniref:hypothetical protein n=1 Tax=Nostoc sp. T09 TaxID=1932621 RepID=UPI0015C50E25|nr:hypothetical protein [Nostoc sp. T09]